MRVPFLTNHSILMEKDHQGMTCLMKASMSGHLEIVEALLNYGANPRVLNNNNESALSLAVMEEKVEICDRLFIAKSDPHQVDN